MRVVEIEHVRGDAVDERRMQEVELVAAAEHARLTRPDERLDRCKGVVDRRVDGAADGAAGPIEKGADGLRIDRVRNVVRNGSDREVGQNLGDLGAIDGGGVHFDLRETFLGS
jgi:hypothetical protein